MTGVIKGKIDTKNVQLIQALEWLSEGISKVPSKEEEMALNEILTKFGKLAELGEFAEENFTAAQWRKFFKK